jgi:hypothetical protein
MLPGVAEETNQPQQPSATPVLLVRRRRHSH